MNHKELQQRLEETGITLPIGTLRRWAAEGLIERPVREARPQKRGRFAEWPEKSLEDAVACWVVRHADPVFGPPPKENLRMLKAAAEKLSKNPWFDFMLMLPALEMIDQFSSKFIVSQVSPYITPHSTLDFKYVSFRAHTLVSKWMAAVEKVRRQIRVQDPVIIIYDWIIDAARDAEGRFILWSVDPNYVPAEPPATRPKAEQWEAFLDGIFYKFNQIILESRSTRFKAFSERPRKSATVEDSPNLGMSLSQIEFYKKEFQSYEDEVYFFFRVPEFKQDLLELVQKYS